MFRWLIIFWICLSATLPSYAQVQSTTSFLDVFPVRVDHKWGYVKFYGTFVDSIIPYKYDYIGDQNLTWNTSDDRLNASSFKIFEIDNKVGLLNSELQEILPNAFNRIRPISDDFFAVEVDSLFTLIDKDQKEYWDGNVYQNICAETTNINEESCFFVRDNNRWGVRKLTGDFLLQPQFAEIRSAGHPGFFIVKNKIRAPFWELINIKGQVLLSGNFEQIEVLDKNFIVIKRQFKPFKECYVRENEGQAFVTNGKEYHSIKKLNEHIIAASIYHTTGPKTLKLLKTGTLEEIYEDKLKQIGGDKKEYVPWYYPLDEKHAVIKDVTPNRRRKRYRIVDSVGQRISIAYDSIMCTNKAGIYFVGYEFVDRFTGRGWNWGLFNSHRSRSQGTVCEHSRIYDFENDIAIVKRGLKYGAIAMRDTAVGNLPCIFDNVFIGDDDKLQTQLDDNMMVYSLTDSLTFEEGTLNANTILFSKNVKKPIREAKLGGEKVVSKNLERIRLSAFDVLNKKVKPGTLELYDRNRLLYSIKWSEEVRSVVELSESQFAIYSNTDPVKLSFSRKPLAKMDFYDCEKDKIISEVKMLGYRRFDTLYQHTAFIDEFGQMGLVNAEGKQVRKNGQPLRYAYIGPFHGGLARVCLEGEMVVNDKFDIGLSSKMELTTQSRLAEEFQLRQTFLPGASKKGQSIDFGIYMIAGCKPAKWGFIDQEGNLAFEVDADYVEDFNEFDKTARVMTHIASDKTINHEVDLGLINDTGRSLIKNKYKDIKRYEQFNVVSVGGTPTMYFKSNGHQIFMNRTRLRAFEEGLALFKNDENKWGYVNGDGEIVIPATFKIARPFSDSLALVADSEGLCYFIDKTGKKVFETNYAAEHWRGIGDFHEDRCWFKGEGWRWGCYDTEGNVVIDANYFYQIKGSDADPSEPYSLPMDFCKGAAKVQVVRSSGNSCSAIIDASGEYILEPDNISRMGPMQANGITWFAHQGKPELGLINKEGQVLKAPAYKEIGTFVDNCARVKSNYDKWGIVNAQGKELVKPKFDGMQEISEGLVAVKTNYSNGWYFIDTLGTTKVKGPFDEVGPYKSGLAYVTKSKKDLIINRGGNIVQFKMGAPVNYAEGIFGMVKDPKASSKKYFFADELGNNLFGTYFEEITPFQLGIAKVRRSNTQVLGRRSRELLGAINKRGVMVVPPKYRNLHLQPDGNIIINPQRFFGITDKQGNVLIEPIYDRIVFYPQNDMIRVEQGEKIGYIWMNPETNKLEWAWELQN